MKILLNNNDLNEALYSVSNLGFVPTMGSLHKGHISLIKRSLKECDKTIVSIFVNPTQFNNKNDYKKYPRNTKKDLRILKKLKVNFIFLPKKHHIYNYKKRSKIKLGKTDKIMCAKYRKGHFEGVIDVMDRLIKIIGPNKIFMGEKDFQQLFLIKKYLLKKYKIKIISCKTIRDNNKIALSSRNFLLNKKGLFTAGKLIRNLISFKKNLKNKKDIKEKIFLKKKELANSFKISIDYLELRNKNNLKIDYRLKNSKLFTAFYLDNVRLIDNF